MIIVINALQRDFPSLNKIKWMATLFCNLKGSFRFVYSDKLSNDEQQVQSMNHKLLKDFDNECRH